MNQNQSNNECLIDFLRFSLPVPNPFDVIEVLGLPLSEFSRESGSPFPNYDSRYCFANIEVHFSENHKNILVNLSGQACRQYEEYMDKIEGWHWKALFKKFLLIMQKLHVLI